MKRHDTYEQLIYITTAETRVLLLMRQGMTNREIAQRLNRSEFTIKTHVERILAKMGARNRAQACALSSEAWPMSLAGD